jgi:pimeloyl-ACP methyl ester carboxylesterase
MSIRNKKDSYSSKASLCVGIDVKRTWSGVCSQLPNISKPTLVIIGTEDVSVPAANSLIIAAKILGAWLVQIQAADHALMSQYPDKFNKVLQTFLTTTPTTTPSS